MRQALALIAFLSLGVGAQPLQQLEQREHIDSKIEQNAKVMRMIEELQASIEQGSRKFSSACLRAFGAPRFCSCITENRPATFTFGEYIAITTQSREDNGYSKLDKEMKAAYDKVAVARDTCVAANKPR
jgi:hypothetical protein